MSVKPILFNTDMVRAIMDDRKTVTRRVVKPQPMFYTGRKYVFADDICPKKWEDCSNIINTYQYQTGDILYVRETWCKFDGAYHYKSDYGYSDCDKQFFEAVSNVKWHPSIHMPKEAARIFLKVKNVRIERLQEIDDEQAKNEGANWKNGKNVGFEEKMRRSSVERFAEIWDSTIKKSDTGRYGWDANPFVWVIEFEMCDKPEGWCSND